MTIVEAAKSCFGKYITFSGRASRREFWKYILFLILVMIILTVLNSIIFGPTVTSEFGVQINSAGDQTPVLFSRTEYSAGWFGTIFGFAILAPLFAATSRRLQDVGRPGVYLLLPFLASGIAFALIYFTSNTVMIEPSLIPEGVEMPTNIAVPSSGGVFFGAWLLAMGTNVLVIFWLTRPSDPNTNKYGPNPNEVSQ